MNTISTAQNNLDLYTQKSEKIAKALDAAKVEQRKKEIAADAFEFSQQAIQALGSTSQSATNRINPLDDLVSSGTITQDQATAVQNAFQSVGKAIQSSGIYNNRPINPLDSLVTAGTITEEQETAIKSAFEASIKPDSAHSKPPVTATLDALVTAGTITQAQEASIQNAFEAAI